MCSWCKILFISLNLSLQCFSSLRGLNFVIPALPAQGSSPNMKSQDLFPINFPKFLQTVLFVTPRKKAAIKVRYLSDFVTKSFKNLDFHYSHHCLSF